MKLCSLPYLKKKKTKMKIHNIVIGERKQNRVQKWHTCEDGKTITYTTNNLHL